MADRPYPLICDAHLDLAWNAIDWNRDLLLGVADIRRREKEQGLATKARGENTVSFPELRQGLLDIGLGSDLELIARELLLQRGAKRGISVDQQDAAVHRPRSYPGSDA